MNSVALFLAFVISAQPLVDADVLEPSVRNEVDHALDRAPLPIPVCSLTGDIFATNGLSRTEIAVKLVSCQRLDGHWYQGTNDVSAVAIEILESL